MSHMTSAHARRILAILMEGGFAKLLLPTLAAYQAKRAITIAKSRSGISGRLSFHELEREDGQTELSVSLLIKPDPFTLLTDEEDFQDEFPR